MTQAFGLIIDGQERPARDGREFDVENPATGETAFTAADAANADVSDAVGAARAAFADGRWSGQPPRERARLLNRAAAALADTIEELADLETLQVGRPVREMRAQLRRLPEWFEYFAAVAQTVEGGVPDVGDGHVNYVRHVPLGVAALVTPWNHPLLILMKKLSAALAAGNSVVVKPSELAPVTPVLLGRLLHEVGLPDGVLNVVTGFGATTGKALTDDPRIDRIDLTGGTPTGRAVAAAAGANLVPVTAELGGKAPVVVFDDVPAPDAVAGALFASFVATGQTCIQGARTLVHRSIFGEVRDELVRRTRALRIGDPTDKATQIGPLVSAAQRDRVAAAVDGAREQGATVLCGGSAPTAPALAAGHYYEPTIVADVTTDMDVWRDEIFGPVTVLVPFETEDDAVRLANDSDYGLAAAVWSRDTARAHRVADRLETGVVWVNDHHRIDPASVWGGMKDSGMGRENGITGYLAYTQQKSVLVSKAADVADWFGDDEEARYS